MLRESMQITGKQVDVSGVTQGFDDQLDIPHAPALVEFAESVVLRDAQRIAIARAELRRRLGEEALIDCAAIVAAFHGFVRIADAIGIPYNTASGGRDLPELREQAGVNAFYRVQNSPA
jgi:alkylhydroperoxidase family enzyme